MKIVIIGAGAAGCFAAANIPHIDGLEVSVFERSGKAMQKVKASGGGRCNVTNSCFDIPTLLNNYPRGKQLLRKTLYRFGPQQTVEWFEKRGVKLKTEPDGRIFPETNDSQTIIDCIWKETVTKNIVFRFHKIVTFIEKSGDKFLLHFNDATTFEADKVVITTGGFAKPEQYNWIKQLGHSFQSPVPSLFTFNIPNNPLTELMGVSVPDALVKISGTKLSTQGPLLITHWGISGPAVLKTSSFAARELAGLNYNFNVVINWIPIFNEEELKNQFKQIRIDSGKQMVVHKNPFNLPKRLWEYLTKLCAITDDTRWGELPAPAQNKLIEHQLRDTYPVKGKTTFKDEFVTCGGVNLSEIDPNTMQSRIVPGLFFAGEILDVDGITGGFNFQHAWSSGWIVAQSVCN